MKSIGADGFPGLRRSGAMMMVLLLGTVDPTGLVAGEGLSPEATLRLIVEANAARDLETLSEYMSHDADAVGYTVDGHKYVGWPLLETEMRPEFEAVQKLELPISYLQVWQKGELAWFAMELDYIRYFDADDLNQRMALPLRETGVLERRDGRWVLVAWHESPRYRARQPTRHAVDGGRSTRAYWGDDRHERGRRVEHHRSGRQQTLSRHAGCRGQRPLYLAGRTAHDDSDARPTVAGDLDATRERP
jgi:hypothetical protein